MLLTPHLDRRIKAARTAFLSEDVTTACNMSYDLIEDSQTPRVIKAQAGFLIEDQELLRGREETWNKAKVIVEEYRKLPVDEIDNEILDLDCRIWMKKAVNHPKYGAKRRERAAGGPAVYSDDSRTSDSSVGINRPEPEDAEAATMNIQSALVIPNESEQRSPSDLAGPKDEKVLSEVVDSALATPKESKQTSPIDSAFGPSTANASRDASNIELVEVRAGKALNDGTVDRDIGMRLRDEDRRPVALDGVNESSEIHELPQPNEDVRSTVEGKGQAREKKNKSKLPKCCIVL